MLRILLRQLLVGCQHGAVACDALVQLLEDVLLDAVLLFVGQLEAFRPKNLNAVVFKRIVRRRDHHAQRVVARRGQERHARGWEHSSENGLNAGCVEARCQAFGDRRARLARIHAQQCAPFAANGRSQRAASGVDGRRIQRVLARLAPDAIGSE